MERAAVSGRAARVPGPPFFQSIRFRLSLTYALAIFVAGTLLIGGTYLWQLSQLDEPVLSIKRRVQMVDRSGRTVEWVIAQGDPVEELLRVFEYNAYLRAADSLKTSSLVALGILFLVAFATGWLLSGWALRPVQRMVTVARDITATDLSRRINLPGPEDEMKQLADTFDAMLDRLQTSFEGQRRFVQDASHELRNPLAVARTNLELALTDPAADADQLRAAGQVAMRSTQRMSDLVDDLLERARYGVPEVARTDIDLVATAREVVDEYEPVASDRDVTLILVAPLAPLSVRVDATAIRRAVGNLVSNAAKFAPSGSEVTVTVEPDERHVTLNVIDEGPGLSADDQQRVFERFWRGPTSASGTGLGLSIVRQIAERHGGSVSVVSEEGSGSTFTLRLPIVGGHAQS
jgi:signal transduction histidine kinase